jgi:hypothetical protein
MHCPNCGTKISTDQKFCRACGLSLERVTELLAELLPAIDADQMGDENTARVKRRLSQLQRLGQIAAITFVGIGGLLILTVCAAMAISAGFILAAWLAGYYALLQRKVAARLPGHATLRAEEATNKLQLEQHSQIAMSATEQTTALLEEQALKQPSEGLHNPIQSDNSALLW